MPSPPIQRSSPLDEQSMPGRERLPPLHEPREQVPLGSQRFPGSVPLSRGSRQLSVSATLRSVRRPASSCQGRRLR